MNTNRLIVNQQFTRGRNPSGFFLFLQNSNNFQKYRKQFKCIIKPQNQRKGGYWQWRIWIVLGILLDIVEIIGIIIAYSVYRKMVQKAKAEYAPRIMQLTDELIMKN